MGKHPAQVPFAKHDAIQAFFLTDRTNRSAWALQFGCGYHKGDLLRGQPAFSESPGPVASSPRVVCGGAVVGATYERPSMAWRYATSPRGVQVSDASDVGSEETAADD